MPPIVAGIAAVVGAIGGAVAAAGAFVASLGAVGSALLGVGISVGLSLLSNALFGKKPGQPQVSSTVRSGVQTQLNVGGDVPREGAFGLVATRGHFAYVNTFGDTNKFLQMVFILSEGWCDGLNRVWVNGTLHSLNSQLVVGNEVARYHIQDFEDKIVVRFFDGRPNQGVDTELVDNANPSSRWTSNSKLAGMCYVSVTLEFDSELFSNIPEFLWELRGLRLYDWRKDSTAGGSGSHRWNNTSTWEFSENPAVCRYNYQRGIFLGGSLVIGQGLSVIDLLQDLYTASANVCDENALGQPRYRVSFIARSDQMHKTALETFDAAMAGSGYERAGQFAPIAGVPQTPVVTITDDDLVVGTSVEWSGKRSRSDLINAVFGQYSDPDSMWQPQSYPAQITTAGETADGERLPTSLDLLMVRSPVQAQRIARIALRDRRHQATARITVGFHMLFLDAGDWIVWNSERFGNITYRIVSRLINTIEEGKTITLELDQISNDVFAFGSADVEPIVVPPTPPSPGLRPSTVSNLNVQADIIEGADGQIRPIIRVTWTPPDDPTIDAVILEFRIVGTVAAQRIRHDDPESGEAIIGTDVLAGTDYEVRATIVTTPPRFTTFTDWVALTTDERWIAARDAALEALLQQVRESIPADLLTIRQDLDQLSSDVNTQITVLRESVGRVNIGVGARFEENRAGVEQALTASADAESALAVFILSLFAETPEGTAEGKLRFVAASTPSGVAATFAIEVRADTESSFAFSGFYMDVGVTALGGASRIRMVADQIVFSNSAGTTLTQALIIDGGTPYLNGLAILPGSIQTPQTFVVPSGSDSISLSADEEAVIELASFNVTADEHTEGVEIHFSMSELFLNQNNSGNTSFRQQIACVRHEGGSNFTFFNPAITVSSQAFVVGTSDLRRLFGMSLFFFDPIGLGGGPGAGTHNYRIWMRVYQFPGTSNNQNYDLEWTTGRVATFLPRF